MRTEWVAAAMPTALVGVLRGPTTPRVASRSSVLLMSPLAIALIARIQPELQTEACRSKAFKDAVASVCVVIRPEFGAGAAKWCLHRAIVEQGTWCMACKGFRCPKRIPTKQPARKPVAMQLARHLEGELIEIARAHLTSGGALPVIHRGKHWAHLLSDCVPPQGMPSSTIQVDGREVLAMLLPDTAEEESNRVRDLSASVKCDMPSNFVVRDK